MKCALLGLILFAVAHSTLTCTGGKVYAKFIKTCTTSAAEESYEIWGSGSLLERSPTFENSKVREIEYCLDPTTNSQYTLRMKDSYGDSWTSGSYLEIQGIDGNTFFKNLMIDNSSEEYTISLYYGANKNAQWKMTSGSVSSDWTQYNFGESGWTQVTLGSVTTAASGTQYFRKTFAGLPNMAAYELGMYYRYGVVAYANGVEVYRDNMPTGTVTSSTAASGSYTSLDYRSILRPGVEVSSTQSVVAIELHFSSGASQTTVDFNAFIALMAPSTPQGNCFVYPYGTTFTASFSTTTAYKVFDFVKGSSLSVGSYLPATFTMSVSGAKPYINGINVFPYTSTTTTINTFNLEAKQDSETEWTNVITASSLSYTSKQLYFVSGFFNADLFSNYRLKAVSSSSTTAYIYEFQMLTCNTAFPTSIEFMQSSYTYWVKYEDVNVKPIIPEFVNCQINPTPAAGLSFDSATCTLSGKATTAGTTSYTVTSIVNGQTFTGSFQLVINTCAGTMISVLRTYKTLAVREAITITDVTTQQAVLTVDISSSQKISTNVDYLLCLTGQKYLLHTDSSVLYWQSQSFAYVRTIFDTNEYDIILRAKYDNNLGITTEYPFNIGYSVKPNESWSYKNGGDFTNWYSTDMSTWTSTASSGSFPAFSSGVQLYKKQFTVSSVDQMAGVVISLKYQYGVLIYLNGHEAFRLGVTGDLSTSSSPSTSLSSVAWRQISLPARTIVTDSSPAVDYIVAGTNTIAIALVLPSSVTTSTFDCAVRMMGAESQSRVYEYTISASGISGSYSATANVFMNYYTYYISGTSCSSNSYDITFNDDRHEWISSVSVQLYYTQTAQYPRQFVLKGKNAADSEWTTLATVTGMTWSLAGQSNRIWVLNNKSYNQYRFENFGTGDSSSCSWKLGRLDLISNTISSSVPALSYTSSIEIYKDIEMGEVYPSNEYYTDFTINPPLPTGLTIDGFTGTISGTAHEFMNPTTYTVSAKKYTGEAATAQFSLSVVVCHGGKNLVTLVARADSSTATDSYKVYQGKGTSGQVVAGVDRLPLVSNLNYGDFCLTHGIYTIELKDTSSSGWTNPAGYYLTVDVGEMKFEMGQVYTGTAPTIVTTMFSSYLPFQIEYDDWKVYKNVDEISSDWNTINFDDSTWTVTKAADIGTSEAVTVYIRRDITLDDVSNYQVLNVRVKYAGGVVCYFNGRKVARFNLEDNFRSSSESIEIHDSTVFSQFHIVLTTVGAVTGKNVIAFEIHRPKDQSSAEPVVFDATGVFGVNDCSIGVDTVVDVTGSTFTSIVKLENFFDLTPVTYGYITNAVTNYLQWSVENLEGTRFNSFAMQTVYARTSFGFSLYGHQDPEDEEWLSMFEGVDLSTVVRGRSAWSVPVGIASFRQFRWEIDDAASAAVYASAYILQYCKSSSTGSCPGVDDYPPVSEGEISPSTCEYGYRGYSYRRCTGGSLGEIQTDKCTYKIPANLLYSMERYSLVMNTQASIPAPTYDNIITRFYLGENTFLPDGLTFDETTGAITGVPTKETEVSSYTVYGENPKGVVTTIIRLSVRKGECKADGVFPKTYVGEVAVYECSLGGSYVGTQKRACVLGAKDGEWQKIQGICMAVVTVVLLIVVVLLILLVVIFILMRTSKKSKAVGGVKGKKGSAKPKSNKPAKKTSAKTVKV